MTGLYMIMDLQEEEHACPWPTYHIETPQRLDVIYEGLKETNLYCHPRIEHLPLREACDSELQLIHTKRYVDDIKSSESMTVEEQEKLCETYEDIYLNKNSWKRAKLAAGSAIDLVDKVVKNRKNGIAFVRPPGHHAMPDAGCGFCIFNNVAIAAKKAADNGLERVLIVDFDVHAGQGTQECIQGDDRLKLITIHRYENGKFWPNLEQCGLYHKYNNTINVPLNGIGFNDSDYADIFQLVVLPVLYDWNPQLIIVSCGFDASLGDPEGYMEVTPAGFSTLIRMLTNTEIPVAAILEGGYFLEALKVDSQFVVRTFLDEFEPVIERKIIDPRVAEVITKIHLIKKLEYRYFNSLHEITKMLSENKNNLIEATDFEGVRTVEVPFETRGIYSPFSENKVEEFKKKLISNIESYEWKQMSSLNEKIIVVSSEKSLFEVTNDGYLRVSENNSLLFHILITLSINPCAKANNCLLTPDVQFKEEQVLKLKQFFKHIPICNL